MRYVGIIEGIYMGYRDIQGHLGTRVAEENHFEEEMEHEMDTGIRRPPISLLGSI